VPDGERISTVPCFSACASAYPPLPIPLAQLTGAGEIQFWIAQIFHRCLQFLIAFQREMRGVQDSSVLRFIGELHNAFREALCRNFVSCVGGEIKKREHVKTMSLIASFLQEFAFPSVGCVDLAPLETHLHRP
jgi:hypothetical protein